MGEKGVSPALSLGSSLDKPRDVNDLYACGDGLRGFYDIRDGIKSGVRNPTTPMLGSMVQKGKFEASASAFVSALKRVDFPTFGSPTIPHRSPICL